MRHTISLKKSRRSRRTWALIVAGLTAASTVLFVGPVLAGANTEELACAALTAPVYQRVNTANTGSMLTTSESEYAHSEAGFTDGRGVQFSAATSPAPGLVDVRDLVNPRNTNQVYILNGNQARTAVTDYRFVDRGIAFYASPIPLSCTVPVYRYRLKSFHRHVVSSVEGAALARQGWLLEGISFYAAPVAPLEPPTPTTPAPVTSEAPATSAIPTISSVEMTTTTSSPITTTTTPTSSEVASSAPTTSQSTTTAEPTDSTEASTSPVTTTTPATTQTTTNPSIDTSTSAAPPITTTTEESPQEPVDTKFSIAVMPDTQQEVFGPNTFSGTKFLNRVQWLVDNAGPDDLDLKYVTHTGDVVNWDTPSHEQYEEASSALAPLTEAGIPFSLSIGNHDSMATGEGGGARDSKNTRTLFRSTETFNTYFTAWKYGSVEGAYEQGKVDNIYSTFAAGGDHWMVLNLEMWARPEVVDWANQIVAAHPDDNVIVVTHSYLESDGSISQSAGYGATSAQYLFDNLISKYSNIKLVFSGHVGSAASRVDTGANGNKVYSFLTAIHSNKTNPVRIIEIDTAAGTLTSKIVAPYDKATTWSGFDETIANIDWID